MTLPAPIPRQPTWPPTPAPTSTSTPVKPRPWPSYYYRALDFVQWPWHKFRDSRAGRYTLWNMKAAARFILIGVVAMIVFVRVMIPIMRPVAKVMFKVMKVTLVWSFIVGIGVLFIFLRFCTGKSKLAKAGR